MATETGLDHRPPKSSNVLVNALLSAVVTTVLAFTTVSPIIGGAVAGYLQRGSYASGAKAGGRSGLIAGLGFIVLSFVPLFAGTSLSMFGMCEMAVMPHWLLWSFWAGLLFVVGLIVAMSAAGGALGVSLSECSSLSSDSVGGRLRSC